MNKKAIKVGVFTISSPGDPVAKSGDTSSFSSVSFDPSFPEGSSVIVIPMVQTFNGAATPGVRIADVTAEGFKFRMNELIGDQPLSSGGHVAETIGWVAFSV